MKKSKNGYTLIEMVLVIAIIVVIGAAFTAGISKYIDGANTSSASVKIQTKAYDLAIDSAKDRLADSTWEMPPVKKGESKPNGPTNPNDGDALGNVTGNLIETEENGKSDVHENENESEVIISGEEKEENKGDTNTDLNTGNGSEGTAKEESKQEDEKPVVNEKQENTGAGSEATTGKKASDLAQPGDDVVGDYMLVKGGMVEGQNKKGIRSIVPESDGSYTVIFQNDSWNAIDCKFTISVSGGTVKVVGGSIWIIQSVFDFYSNNAPKDGVYVLDDAQLSKLESEFGLKVCL